MKGLDFREEGIFTQVFVPEENQDCLVSLLNGLVEMDSPLVSATFHQNGGLAIVRRENSCIYIADCRNQRGQTVEISLILGMDGSMEPMLVQTFMKMAVDQQISGQGKVFSVNAVMFMEAARDVNDTYKRILMMENKIEGKDTLNMENQKFFVYSMNKFKFANPASLEEVWLTFLENPQHELLLRHPALPEPLQKAIELTKNMI